MTKQEIIKICDEEILLYHRAPDKLNDEQETYLDFYESVKALAMQQDHPTEKGGAE